MFLYHGISNRVRFEIQSREEVRIMQGFQDVFKRTEIKYILRIDQYEALMERLQGIAKIDQYGETDILNIYYDTPEFSLIRSSLEKPVYKEKLRLRSYGIPKEETTSFIEIKKKYKGVVYKRRIDAPYSRAKGYLEGRNDLLQKSQIKSEIDAFRTGYQGLRPAMAISYKRIALAGIQDPNLRITFDRQIRWRTDRLDLRAGAAGEDLLKEGERLMEVKIANAFPMELSRIFSELGIFPGSFSKYGEGYLTMMKRSAAVACQTPDAAAASELGNRENLGYAS